MIRVLLRYAYFLCVCVFVFFFVFFFATNGSPMYQSLIKTEKYSELETNEILKRVASANAILKHYKSSSLMTV